jgi:O-antigen/teichoic acid export membrane protein
LTSLVQNAADKGVFHLFAANLAIGALAFGAQLLVVKYLTPAEMGYVKTLQSFMAIATLIAGFGFNTAVAKLCSERRPAAERAYIFRRCFISSLLPIGATLLLIFVIARMGLFSPDQTVNRWMPVYMLMIPGYVLSAIAMIYLQAAKRIKLMATTQLLTRLAGATLVVAAAAVFYFRGFIFATVAVNTLALLPLLWMLRSDISSKAVATDARKQSFHYAGWGLAANVVETAGGSLHILLLNYLCADRDAIGLYGIATIFLLGLNQITGTIQSVASPYFSEKSSDRAEFTRVLKKYQRLLVLVALAATALSVLVVPWFVSVVYGDAYAPVGVFFRILSLKYFFWSCYAIAAVAIFGMGKIKHYFLSVTVAAVLGFIVSSTAITFWGPTGAAIAETATAALTCMTVLIMLRRLLRSSQTA